MSASSCYNDHDNKFQRIEYLTYSLKLNFYEQGILFFLCKLCRFRSAGKKQRYTQNCNDIRHEATYYGCVVCQLRFRHHKRYVSNCSLTVFHLLVYYVDFIRFTLILTLPNLTLFNLCNVIVQMTWEWSKKYNFWTVHVLTLFTLREFQFFII